MTRERAIEILKKCVSDVEEHGDLSEPHETADEVLCELLRSLGYGDVVEIYDSFDKWYA